MNDLNRRMAVQSRNTSPPNVSGVLETLAAGISLAVARPYLFLLPLIVDLWLWLGIQIRPNALVESMQTILREQGGDSGVEASRILTDVSDRLRVSDILGSLTPSVFSGLSNETFLANVLALIAPAVTDGVDRSAMYATWRDGLSGDYVPSSDLAVIGLALLFFVGATLILSIFKASIAIAVRGDDAAAGALFRDIASGWLRVLALLALVVSALVVIVLPVLVVAQLVSLVGIPVIALVSLALLIFGGLGAITMYFLLDAMFIYRVGPIQAARMSYAVARINFAQSWRFVASSLLIATGVLQVWSVIIANPPGVIVALVVNAALGTALSIASMMFFYDRARLPRPYSSIRSLPFSRPIPPQSPRR